jgi:hypothetical protein
MPTGEYNEPMTRRESQSPLGEHGFLWDHPDRVLGPDVGAEVTESLRSTLIRLELASGHTAGRLERYEDSNRGIRYSGWALRTPPDNDREVGLLKASPLGAATYLTLISWEYSKGAKAILTSSGEAVNVLPRLEERFSFVATGGGQAILSSHEVALQNIPGSREDSYLTCGEMERFREMSAGVGGLTHYSLYKINILLDVLNDIRSNA